MQGWVSRSTLKLANFYTVRSALDEGDQAIISVNYDNPQFSQELRQLDSAQHPDDIERARKWHSLLWRSLFSTRRYRRYCDPMFHTSWSPGYNLPKTLHLAFYNR